MIGNNYNKKSGQALLIIVLLLAVLLTVVLSVSFTSKTETQLTKLEEDNQKALAAAESGIEYALKQGGVPKLSSLPGLSQFTGSVNITQSQASTFLTPALAQNDQYTLYLTKYDNSSNSFSGNYSGGDITIYYGNSSYICNNIVLEIAVLNGTYPNYSVRRWVADVGNKLGVNTKNNIGHQISKTTFDGVDFYCDTDPVPIASVSDAKLLIARTLYSSTKLYFQAGSGGVFPEQGRYLNSTASTQTGVTKSIQLFQSYPQIPSNFFTSIF